LRPARWSAPLGLAGVVAAATAFIAHFALRNHVRQNDELISVVGARSLQEDFFSGLVHPLPYNGRGPEKLTSVLLAGVNSIASTTAAEFQAGHVLVALAWALAAIPVFALARGLGLRTWQALAVAALAVIGPWSVFGVTLLNTALGYLTFTVLLWAMWRSAVRPGLLADATVLGAFLLAIAARVGHAPFVFALAPAIVVARWRDRPPEEPVWQALRRLPVRIARAHPLLVATAAVGLAALVAVGQKRLVGDYGSNVLGQHIDAAELWRRTKILTGRTAEALAFVPVVLALPWIAREAWRPRSRESGTFAVLAAGVLVAFLYVAYAAALEDRYMVVVAPVLLLAFGRALFAGEVSVVAVLVLSVLVGRLVATAGRYPTDEPFSYFIAPGSQFFHRVLEGRLSAALPFHTSHLGTIVLAAAVAVALAAAGARHAGPRAAKAIPLAVVACLVVYAVAGAAHSMNKFTKLTGPVDLSWKAQTYVDAASGGAPVAMLAENPAEDAGRVQRWFDSLYFNSSVVLSVSRPGRRGFTCCPPHSNFPVTFDIARDGEVRLSGPLPKLLLVPQGWMPLGFDGKPVANGWDGFRLERFDAAPRATFRAFAHFKDGWGAPGRPARVHAYPRVQPGLACLTANLVAPPADFGAGTVRYAIRGGARRVAGSLALGEVRAVEIPLRGRRAADLTITAAPGARVLDGRTVTMQVADIHVGPCA
jgi:hypothetical protein